MGRILNSVICAPITSTVRDLATEVILGPEVGLEHDSAANFDNTFQLHRSGLVKFVGRASEEAMEQACNALAAAVGCNRR
jgi:mRNA interferase MazF